MLDVDYSVRNTVDGSLVMVGPDAIDRGIIEVTYVPEDGDVEKSESISMDVEQARMVAAAILRACDDAEATQKAEKP